MASRRSLFCITLFFSLAGGLGCARKSDLFRTSYDKELRIALRKQRGGWVSRGPQKDTTQALWAYLQPGQFLRVVLETPRPLHEEGMGWLLIRIDTLRVFEDGMVYVPWGGGVRVGGMALDSAQRILEESARRIFVNARLRLYPLYAYYLFGQVPQPGRILLDKVQTNLLELLPFMAPQLRQTDFSRIKILRGNLQDPQVFLIDAREAFVLSEGFGVQAGDIIIAEPRDIVRLRLEVENYLGVFGALQLLNLILVLAFRFGL
ncbi:MAG: hypothetical protein N2170_08865 [Bacteroidia bacterium]|nr:hypothetical protein [Bacteroidia bacterium]